MNAIARVNNVKLAILHLNSVPVLTTQKLAEFYNTDANNIKVNHSRNKDRFVQGKHYFKLEGSELKEFKDWVTQSNLVEISKNTRSLILWTERGAARHAKMLETDQAWDIFEQLEDCYFNRQEILTKTHKSDRTPLHEAHALLVTKTKHLNVGDAWKLIHQRFGVSSIDEIPFDQIPVAVEYVHHLIALYSNSDRKQFTDSDLQNLHALATHMIWVREWWRTFGDAIRTINPTMASLVHSHFADGGSIAWRYLHADKREALKDCVKDYDWFLPYSERKIMNS